jgi:hypothetical protein
MEKFLMWFINGKRQVIELKRRAQEKRARRVATRPEPTIIGNCDSWIFIVGKKRVESSPALAGKGSLPDCNRDFIHSLFTDPDPMLMNNLWVSCGSAVHEPGASRMVEQKLFNMHITVEQTPAFYRNWLMPHPKS